MSARSGDGRGLAWPLALVKGVRVSRVLCLEMRWAWEFQNEYVLASIMVNGGDVLSEDEDCKLYPS